MSAAVAVIVSAGLLGVSGSMHCALMCGPVASVIGGGCARRSVASHAGRATTYVALGAILGAAGERLAESELFGVVGEGSRFVVAATLLLAGLSLAGVGVRLPVRLPRIGALDRLRVRLGAELVASSPSLAYARGLAWGLLPCGLLYSALTLAAASASPGAGALVMAVFALATMPVFALLDALTRRARGALRAPLVKRVAGIVLVGAGLSHLAIMAEENALVGLRKERPCCAGKHGGGT